jgi:hypothetical protein
MEHTKYNTALDLQGLTIDQVRDLYDLGKETVNRVGHTGLRLNNREGWNILIYFEDEYKRVFPAFEHLKDFFFVTFEDFIRIHFTPNINPNK